MPNLPPRRPCILKNPPAGGSVFTSGYNMAGMTVELCAAWALAHGGYTTFGITYGATYGAGGACWFGPTPTPDKLVASSFCTTSCPGAPGEQCGGPVQGDGSSPMSYYAPSPPPPAPPGPPPSPPPPSPPPPDPAPPGEQATLSSVLGDTAPHLHPRGMFRAHTNRWPTRH